MWEICSRAAPARRRGDRACADAVDRRGPNGPKLRRAVAGQPGLRAVASSDVPFVAAADEVSERRGAAGLLLPAPPATGGLAWGAIRGADDQRPSGCPRDDRQLHGRGTQTLPPNQSAPLGPLIFVNDTYFSTIGAPLVSGRFFSERDDENAPAAVIVNETLARRYFPSVDPVGRRLKIGGPERPTNTWMSVVGVVGDMSYSGLDAPSEPAVYLPFRQATSNNQYVVVRTAGDPQSLAPAVQRAVAELDKDLPVSSLRTMDQLMVESKAPPRFRTILVSLFAIVGLTLASIGIYGVMAYAVAERTHEIGVRLALGADRADVLGMVLGEAMRLAAAGVAIGLAGAAATTQLIRSLLFGVTPYDVPTFAGIAALLAATAFVASYIPARRATRVDPMMALRYE